MRHTLADYYLYLGGKGYLRWLSDELYLKIAYRLMFHKKLDLKNPKSFNEKLQWLKLHNRKEEFITMVDKYRVREYIAKTIGEEYLIPLLGVWDDPDSIDFSLLPNQFVLKCNHDSGSVVICKDKNSFDIDKAKNKLKRRLKKGTFYYGREWPYKFVKPCIIAEQYMEDSTGHELKDYKVHNFNGIAKVILVCKDRFKEKGMTEDFFSEDWEHLEVKRIRHPNSKESIACPENLTKMIELSEILSKDIPFLRTDFYEINGKLYFGELTFYPASGFAGFDPKEYDIKFGELINIPGGGIALINEGFIVYIHSSNEHSELKDYKFFCFHGKVHFFKIDFDRFISHRANYYNREGTILPFGEIVCPPDQDKQLDMPVNLLLMIELAEKISAGSKFMRVDFYESNSKVFFGEITFFPASGFGKLIPEGIDETIGKLLNVDE